MNENSNEEYVWYKNSSDENAAYLLKGDSKVCVVHKQDDVWYLRLYRFGGVSCDISVPLDVDFDSLEGAIRAAISRLLDECFESGAHLPNIDTV